MNPQSSLSPITVLAAITVIFVASLVGSFFMASEMMRQADHTKLGSTDVPVMQTARTATVVVTTTSGQAVATSSARRFLILQSNASVGPTIYCQTNGVAAVGSTGFFITASTTIYFDDLRPYVGAINCIASSTVQLLVTEG